MLTDPQLQVLAAAIRASADQTVIDSLAIRNDMALADWCNSPSTFVVWKPRVTADEIMQNGFDWVQVDNLSVGKARIWEWLFDNADRAIDASKANVRAGIDECWKGTAAMLAVRAAIYVHCKRFASQVEKIFATGTGSDAVPGLLTYAGPISTNEVSQALNRF